MSDTIKVAVMSVAVSALSATAGYWASRPAAPSVQYVLQVPPHAIEGTAPQFDSGDTKFVVDPDADDVQSTNRSCDPAGGDCDDEPDDPSEAVTHT